MKTVPKLVILVTIATCLPKCTTRSSDNMTYQTMQAMMTFFNEFNRVYGMFIARNDFNYWFSSRGWNAKKMAESEYDFIIVGSGSAGSVIANRLSEETRWKILLLEVGMPETNIMSVPVLAPAFQFTKHDWGYFMEREPGDFNGLEDQRMYWPRGRSLGGTSTINYMIYTRGNRWDYDRWAANGNPGWSYNDVLPYFTKSERAKLRFADYKFHRTDGYLSVEDSYQSKLLDSFIEGAAELGLPHVDYNAPTSSFGVSAIQANIRRGRRNSVATAFLWPARHRKNLDIVVGAYVTKVLIEPKSRDAYGIIYEKNGRQRKVYAKREVILSAGAFNSPQLLMLSGIGPRKHLQDLGIPVLKDLPVGQNLHDHLTFPGMAFLVNESISINAANVFPTTNTYLTNGTGPYTSLGGAEGIGYIKTEVADYPEDYPDVELLFIGGTLASDYGIATRRGMRITDAVFDSIFRPIVNKHHWTVFPLVLHPKSTGHMELKSKNPRDYPKFYGNFFSDPTNSDIRTFIAAIRYVQRLSDTSAFQKYASKLNPRKMHGCNHLQFDSDAYWECCVRSISVTLHHQVGTAKMGPKGDPTAVVDERLRVHGIKRLRVADCSIIPFALGAHTNAPSIMVGEKAADLIKEDWGMLKGRL